MFVEEVAGVVEGDVIGSSFGLLSFIGFPAAGFA
jgi:hypothetical protein